MFFSDLIISSTVVPPFSSVFFPAFLYSDLVLSRESSSFKKMGPRIFVFIIGGATRSEVLEISFDLFSTNGCFLVVWVCFDEA